MQDFVHQQKGLGFKSLGFAVQAEELSLSDVGLRVHPESPIPLNEGIWLKS